MPRFGAKRETLQLLNSSTRFFTVPYCHIFRLRPFLPWDSCSGFSTLVPAPAGIVRGPAGSSYCRKFRCICQGLNCVELHPPSCSHYRIYSKGCPDLQECSRSEAWGQVGRRTSRMVLSGRRQALLSPHSRHRRRQPQPRHFHHSSNNSSNNNTGTSSARRRSST